VKRNQPALLSRYVAAFRHAEAGALEKARAELQSLASGVAVEERALVEAQLAKVSTGG